MSIRVSHSSGGHPFKGYIPASVNLALGETSWGYLSPIFFNLLCSLFVEFRLFENKVSSVVLETVARDVDHPGNFLNQYFIVPGGRSRPHR